MEVDALQNLHDEQTSDYQSFGSKIHPSSQSRKISLGVMADPIANTRRGSMKGNRVIVPNRERSSSNEGNFNGEKRKIEGVTASINMMQTGGPQGIKCFQITKSFNQRTPTSETFLQANQASNLVVSTARLDKPDGDKVGSAPAKSLVEFFSNQTSALHSSYYNQNKVDGITSTRKVRKDGSSVRVGEFTFTTAHETFRSDKTKLQDKANTTENRTESLRMKLWEILGTPSAPKAQHLGSQTHNMDDDDESDVPEQHFDQNDDRVVKIIQNSDTIETDSENPDHTIKRPVTRSWSRKRASAKMQPTKCGPSSRDKQKHQDKNVFNFVESWKERQSAFLDGASSMHMRKKSESSKSRIGPRKICFSENDNAGKPFQDNSKNDKPRHQTVSIGNKTGGQAPGQYKECPLIEGIIQENKDFLQSPTVNKKDQRVGPEGLADENQQELTSNPVVDNVADPQDNIQSPTFRLKTPTLNSSPSSTPKMDERENSVTVNSPASTERSYSQGVIHNLRTLQMSQTDSDRLRIERLQDMENLEDSPPRKAASFVKEKDAQNDWSYSSSGEKTFQESQEGSRERQPAEKKMPTLLPIKRLCTREGIKFNDCGPASPSSKGESDWIREASDQNLEDGFARAVELLALELGKFSCKLKSVTSQKSSEILMSVAEEIHLLLQDVHSQIDTDIGKLTSLSKSKRKRLEARFEDQQKQLRLIHKKFKEQVNLHLQDCRSTIEGLEADQLEIKGALDKQRASHRKLLSQAEEAVEIQLDDAKRRITSIQELARGKSLQLKHVIAMCLKEGILD